MASGLHGRKPPKPSVSTYGHGRKPPKPKPDSDNCCPMVAAVRSVRRGQFRLARRYAGMSVRLIATRITGGTVLDHVFDLLPSLLLLALAAQPLLIVSY